MRTYRGFKVGLNLCLLSLSLSISFFLSPRFFLFSLSFPSGWQSFGLVVVDVEQVSAQVEREKH